MATALMGYNKCCHISAGLPGLLFATGYTPHQTRRLAYNSHPPQTYPHPENPLLRHTNVFHRTRLLDSCSYHAHINPRSGNTVALEIIEKMFTKYNKKQPWHIIMVSLNTSSLTFKPETYRKNSEKKFMGKSENNENFCILFDIHTSSSCLTDGGYFSDDEIIRSSMTSLILVYWDFEYLFYCLETSWGNTRTMNQLLFPRIHTLLLRAWFDWP